MGWLGEPPLLFLRGIGGPEIAIVAVVILLLFGATRLPKMGASLGHGLRAFKDAVTGKSEPDTEEADGKGVKSSSNMDEEQR